MYLRWLKTEWKNILILKFLYQDREHSCLFFTVHGTVFSQYIKMHKITWAQAVPITDLCTAVVSNSCMPIARLGYLSGQTHHHDDTGRGRPQDPLCGTHVACRLCVGCTCFKEIPVIGCCHLKDIWKDHRSIKEKAKVPSTCLPLLVFEHSMVT